MFHALHTDGASLVLEARDGLRPLLRHCGLRLDEQELVPFDRLPKSGGFRLDQPAGFALPPAEGFGWLGPPMIRVRDGRGKPLRFLADSVTTGSSGGALTIAAADSGCALELRIDIAIRAQAFVFSCEVQNVGSAPVEIERLASALLPVGRDFTRILSWRGEHAAEGLVCEEALPAQGWIRETRQGVTGHGGPPGLYLLGGATQDHQGPAMALQLAWSGNTRVAVERLPDNTLALAAEAVLEPGEIRLGPGQSWAAPDAIVALSDRGANAVREIQHAAVRARMRWPGGEMTARPVHLNTWEACYFAHDGQRIEDLAESAAALGVERFVLDDGWFKGREHDRAGLGDWIADPVKYPAGLRPVADKVTSLGMQFGLWVEPEMVNPDSDLYRSHPDWVLAVPGYGRPTARHQLVLDLRRPEVSEYLFGALDTLLREVPIAYLKWDHNRPLAPPGGALQVKAFYDLLERIRTAHPKVEIESCAAGGGRADAGVAAFVHRFWASDNLDAVSRLAIQRSFLAFLPPETMGSHVGAAPAHATGRTQSLPFRAAVACMGHFGLELDPQKLADRDRVELADWIAFYKAERGLLHGGLVDTGDIDSNAHWHAFGNTEARLVFVVVERPPAGQRLPALRLAFAGEGGWSARLVRTTLPEKSRLWPEVRRWAELLPESRAWDGKALAGTGIPLPPLPAESIAILRLERVR